MKRPGSLRLRLLATLRTGALAASPTVALAATGAATGELPLRDIHMPDPVSGWPPAPGWWLLAGMLLIALLTVLIMTLRRYLANRPLRLARQQALVELQHCEQQWLSQQDHQRYLIELNQLLKRCCRLRHPAAMALTGQDWKQFLLRQSSDLEESQAHLLSEGQYLPPDCINPDRLNRLASVCDRLVRALLSGKEASA